MSDERNYEGILHTLGWLNTQGQRDLQALKQMFEQNDAHIHQLMLVIGRAQGPDVRHLDRALSGMQQAAVSLTIFIKDTRTGMSMLKGEL